jgi:ABC-2 type transport system permease protein
MISVALLFSYGALARLGMGEGSPMATVHVPISLVLYAAMYFVGGYFLYSSVFAAIGAASSNDQDAQQLQWLAMTPLVFCMLICNVILSDPSSKISVVLSEVPLFSPVLMALRISLKTPPGWQIILSVVLLVLATVGAIYASAKIYRVGILMYGKRPSLVEMFRWLRYS